MKSILIIEDEISMANGLKDNLEFEGYQVETAPDGTTGLAKIREKLFDLVLLDVMLPGISGFEICKTARREGISTPIILLTAKGEEIDKVVGLELGADDYITKPFSLRELLARIRAILRRVPEADSRSGEGRWVTIGKLQVHFDRFQAREGDHEVKLTHKEFQVLLYLYKHAGEAVNRDDLMSQVWGIDSDITTRTVDNFILKLRQKVEPDPNNPRVILTIHGSGYRMIQH